MSTRYTDLTNTTFPNSFQNVPQFLDMTAADASLVAQFNDAMRAGNLAQASTILAQIPNGSQKIINAVKMNTIRDTLLAMERFYDDDIEDYITQKQNEWKAIIDLLSYFSTFSTATQYQKNNIVSYTVDGLTQLYINIYDGVTPIGTYPTSETYWRVFTVRGVKGDDGVENTTFDFAWDSSKPYNENTIVTSGGSWWLCILANTNQQPNDGSSYWTKILSTTQTIYPVQPSQPAGQATGELWFKVV